MSSPCALLHALVLIRAARNRATKILALADELGIPALPDLIRDFLSHQLDADTGLQHLTTSTGRVRVSHSASATFISPSDPCGIGCTRHKQIRATPSWYHGPECYDTVFVNTDDGHEGMLGMHVAWVLCLFVLPCTDGLSYPCALIHWFDYIAEDPDELTGMWMVKPSLANRTHDLAVIHIDTIVRATHLIPIFGRERVPPFITFHNSLDTYRGFYINHFVDHHAFELSF